MNQQINLRLPENLLVSAKSYAKKNGFGTVQEFIKETIRDKLFDDDEPELTKAQVDKLVNYALYCKERNLLGTEEELFKRLRRDRK